MFFEAKCCRFWLLWLVLSVAFVNMSFAIRKPFTKFRKGRSASIRGGENLPLRVRTTSGLVEGKNVKLSNYTIVNQYLGIPYAEPPIGKYRWAKAMPRVKNDVYWNATYHRAICPQSLQVPLPEYLLPIWYQKNSAFMKSFKMDEDCLHLNIYVPVKRKNKDGSQAMGITGKLPVMIYFHGFTYSEGSGNFFDGSILAAHGNVIVVTFNYRLGILGFLSNGDETLPGNYGLWDQLQAVKWVTRNIGQFQGDKKRITAFGSGAGAASIGILMLSKQTEKNAKDGIKGERPVNITQAHFRSAILQSGSALSPWALADDAPMVAKIRPSLVNCSSSSKTPQIVDCLRSKKWRDIMKIVEPTRQQPQKKFSLLFGPVLDGKNGLLVDSPQNIIKDREFINYNTMIGVTRGDGFGYVSSKETTKLCRKPKYLSCPSKSVYTKREFNMDMDSLVSSLTGAEADNCKAMWNEFVDFLYTGQSKTEENDFKKALVDISTDLQWVKPAISKADAQAAMHHPTYFYSFDHHPGESPEGDWLSSALGEDLPFVFGAPFNSKAFPLFPYNYTDNDAMLSDAIMTYWTNFASTGDPMEERKQEPTFNTEVPNAFTEIDWVNYNSAEQSYLHISTSPKILDHYRWLKVNLWEKLVSKRSSFTAPSSESVPTLTTTETTNTQMTTTEDTKPQARKENNGLQLTLALVMGFPLIVLNILVLGLLLYRKKKHKYEMEKLRSELKHYRKQRKPPTKFNKTLIKPGADVNQNDKLNPPSYISQGYSNYDQMKKSQTLSSHLLSPASYKSDSGVNGNSGDRNFLHPSENLKSGCGSVEPCSNSGSEGNASRVSKEIMSFDQKGDELALARNTYDSLADLAFVPEKYGCYPNGCFRNRESCTSNWPRNESNNGINCQDPNLADKFQKCLLHPISQVDQLKQILPSTNLIPKQDPRVRCMSAMAFTNSPDKDYCPSLNSTTSLPRACMGSKSQWSVETTHYPTTPRSAVRCTKDIPNRHKNVTTNIDGQGNFRDGGLTNTSLAAVLCPPPYFHEDSKANDRRSAYSTFSSVTTKL